MDDDRRIGGTPKRFTANTGENVENVQDFVRIELKMKLGTARAVSRILIDKLSQKLFFASVSSVFSKMYLTKQIYF